MLAPHRYETYVSGVSENTGSAQISGKYIDNVRMIPKDISARQATVDTGEDYVHTTVPPVTSVKMWGTYGIGCEMEVIKTTAPILQNVFFIQRNNYAYNKAYIGFIGGFSGNQNVTTADKWSIKTRYTFRSKN